MTGVTAWGLGDDSIDKGEPKFSPYKVTEKLGRMVHSCNPGSGEAETDRHPGWGVGAPQPASRLSKQAGGLYACTRSLLQSMGVVSLLFDIPVLIDCNLIL